MVYYTFEVLHGVDQNEAGRGIAVYPPVDDNLEQLR